MKVTIKPSHKPEKKFDAVFEGDGVHKTIPFGAKGYDDFTKTKDEAQKDLYIKRHTARENFNDPMTAGSLSRWILWNKPSLQESIKDFKKRFSII
jgi:hypothetical protein